MSVAISESTEGSENLEDYEVNSTGLQQVLVYLVHHVNTLSDKYSALERQVNDFQNSIDSSIDIRKISILKEASDFTISHNLEMKSGFESQLSELSRDFKETRDTCELFLQNTRSRIIPENEEEDDDSMDGSSFNSSLPEDRPFDPRFNDMQTEIDHLNKLYKDLDTRVIACESYSRRDCLIISGIPDRISADALQTEVLNILFHLGIRNVNRKDISACHRLYKPRGSQYPARVIVKFVNRTIVMPWQSLLRQLKKQD